MEQKTKMHVNLSFWEYIARQGEVLQKRIREIAMMSLNRFYKYHMSKGKRVTAFLISLALAVSLTACASQPVGEQAGLPLDDLPGNVLSGEVSDSTPPSAPERSDFPEQTREPVFPTYTTGKGNQVEGGFQVYLPDGWMDKVAAENFETDTTYALEFFHIASRDAGDGGHLVSIHAFPEETGDPEFPQERVLGTLVEDEVEGVTYVLYAVFPSDVQGSIDAMDEYQELSEQVDDLLASVEARGRFTFVPADETS